ncbi:MAG: J domain-containing protein [Lachnospiraceae bacterium]|nr:J domain-containing protein [Lachnospiraceae bacterium]
MKMVDWYQVLGVSSHAPEEEIKTVYRKLAKRYHPDMHPGDEECGRRFREISEAYSILSDPEKRRAYDEERSRGFQEKNVERAKTHDSMPDVNPVDFQNVYRSFENFFGFNPDTKDIVNEDRLRQGTKNPLDASDIFDKFMGIKRQS